MTRSLRLPVLGTLVLAVALLLSLLTVPPTRAEAQVPSRPHRGGIQVLDYDLGPRSFRVAGFHANGPDGWAGKRLAPLDLAGRVYAPRHLTGRRLPLVVVAHGLWWTCSDRPAFAVYEKAIDELSSPDPAVQQHASDVLTRVGPRVAGWPCRHGVAPTRSDTGYDYLARSLVRQGFVVVSVSANGVNGGEIGEAADKARALVVDEHLRLWQQLVEHGDGPLRDAFTSATGHHRVRLHIRRGIDFHNVGLVGHSRGGRGVMWAAADVNRRFLPPGVRVRAVFGLAAAGPALIDSGTDPYTVSRTPVATWSGSCDATGGTDFNVLAARKHNRVNIAITVEGADHNQLNTVWAPGSGAMGATDDAYHDPADPTRCSADDPSQTTGVTFVPQLSGQVERRVAATYITAFLARYQQQRSNFDALLRGHCDPLQRIATVHVRRF